jgi:hypothetical protein
VKRAAEVGMNPASAARQPISNANSPARPPARVCALTGVEGVRVADDGPALVSGYRSPASRAGHTPTGDRLGRLVTTSARR